MNPELKRIILQSTFQIQEGTYAYATVKSVPADKHFLVAVDVDEITVVTETQRLKELDLIEKNRDDWCLIALNISAPFYSVGFLAAVSEAIANQKMNVLIVSTYSKDYILVKAGLKEKARKALLRLGLKEKPV
jgi:hypothetical protein